MIRDNMKGMKRTGCLLAVMLLGVLAQAQDTLALTLNKAIEIALSENPTIKVADQEIALKEEAKKEAMWGLFPEANLTGSYSRSIKKQTFAMSGQQVKIGTNNSYSGGLVISLPVFAPTLYRSITLTKQDVELAQEKARSSRLDMVAEVTKAYFQLMLSQDSYMTLQRSYKQSEDNYNVVKAKYEQGAVSEYDKITAEVQMRSIKPSLVSAQNGVNLAKLQLKVLMGVTADLDIAVDGNLKDYEDDVFANEMQQLNYTLLNNTAMKQLDLNEKMARQNIKLAQANFLPTLALSFQYLYTSLNDDFRFNKYVWNPYSTLGLSLSIPLFKGGNFSKVKQAKIQLGQLEQTRINTERQLNMQVITYQDNMAASAEQVSSNKEAIVQAEKGRMIAEKRYEVGRGTILELNSSEVSLTEAELTYNQSIYDYLTAKADLENVLGQDYANTTQNNRK